MKPWTASLWFLCPFFCAFVVPATLRADPLPLRSERSLRLPQGPAPRWMQLAAGRPEVELNNFAISFDVSSSKLVVVWALKL